MVKVTDEAVKSALTTWICGSAPNSTMDEDMRAALAAALPHLQAGYAVKQLEWGKLLYTEDYNFMQSAETSIGKYVATDSGWFLQGQSDWYGADSLEDAKAAAQADFERRVRECIVGGFDVTSLDLSILEKLSEKADEFDIPDDLGHWPDIQDAMITVGDLRKVRNFLQDFHALSAATTTEAGR